ncbi:Sec20-domain-containing protein [Lactarius psammicola]|nr:Sec20-domain-containing protein [Lactarius psammicola]
MPPLPPTFDDATSASIASVQRRQSDLRDFQIPRLRGCTESLATQQQYAAELREDLETVMRLIESLDESVDIQRNERSRRDLRGIVEGFRTDLSQLRRDMRSALLASKRAIDSKASSNREELLQSSVLKQTKAPGGKSTEDAVMKTQADVTDALRRTMALMQNELERSVLSTQMLEASTASLKATSSTHDMLTGLLGTSKQLVTALEKADWLDRLLIFAALIFFALVILFILKQRIVDRGLRIAFFWTRFLPALDHRDDSRLVAANGVVTEKAATIASSIVASVTTALASQVAHAVESSGDPLATGLLDDISDATPHVTADLGAVGSGLSPTLTASLTSETPHPESIHDEL